MEPQELHAVIGVIKTVGDTVRELKEVPSGHLYAALSAHLDLATYQRIIETLKQTGLVEEHGMNMLVWTGKEVD